MPQAHPANIPVAVVVPVKNEEKNLLKCLSRLTRFSEVFVVDSSSTDLTPDIAKQAGAKYINFEWTGTYPKKRNWFLLNHRPQMNWVLFLDADEFVDDTFCDAISDAVSSDKHSGYWLNYTNYFLGKKLRHGVKQRKLALFKVGAGLYEKINEKGWSTLDMEIHEHPIISEGSIGEIAHEIEHNDFRGLEKFISRHNDYAQWESKRLQLLMSDTSENWGNLTRRQKFKYKNIRKWWFASFYFLLTYIVKGGWLDGGTGFQYAFYKYWYFSTIRLMSQKD